MEMLKNKTLIIICGVPLSGKTTIANKVSRELGIRHLDVDHDIRFPIFGAPEQDADLSTEGKEQERREMLSAYKVLLAAAEEYLSLGKSVILTATFSRNIYWLLTQEILAKHPETQLKVIQCQIIDDKEEEIWRRIHERGVHTVNSPVHYREVRDRYIKLPVDHKIIDTSGSNNLENKISQVLNYVFDK